MDRVLGLPEDEAEPAPATTRSGETRRASCFAYCRRGTDLTGKRILDFGCGAGRTLRHFVPEAERGEVWGADIDRASIEWLQENLCPPLNAVQCDVDPPLPFEDGAFDFAWAISVFTHLSGDSADWLLELHRVLGPGGLLMASYMGEWNSERIAREPWDEDRVGMNVLRHDWPWSIGGPMILDLRLVGPRALGPGLRDRRRHPAVPQPELGDAAQEERVAHARGTARPRRRPARSSQPCGTTSLSSRPRSSSFARTISS